MKTTKMCQINLLGQEGCFNVLRVVASVSLPTYMHAATNPACIVDYTGTVSEMTVLFRLAHGT